MIPNFMWISLACEFNEDDTIVILHEEALNPDLGSDDPLAYGPWRVGTYDASTCELIAPQTWSYQDSPCADEQAALDAWFAEYPPEEPAP